MCLALEVYFKWTILILINNFLPVFDVWKIYILQEADGLLFVSFTQPYKFLGRSVNRLFLEVYANSFINVYNIWLSVLNLSRINHENFEKFLLS